jgi:serine/threonine protein kinase
MFNGNHRFKLLRQLGSGGMGVVYEALDQHRNTRVALKTLQETDAHLLYRLKRELRSLRDLVHRNLVVLDELFEEGGHWFFTMELLDGEDLHTYFHRIASARHDSTPTLPAGGLAPPPLATAIIRPASMAHGAGDHLQPVAIDFQRIREVFAQIAEGLLAIHDAGKVHRDIKPSNIIITPDGRAVILDFGLVSEQWGAGRSGEGEIVGTSRYMAPEQAAVQVVGPPADWASGLQRRSRYNGLASRAAVRQTSRHRRPAGGLSVIERRPNVERCHPTLSSQVSAAATVRTSGGGMPAFQDASRQPSNHHADENGSMPPNRRSIGSP